MTALNGHWMVALPAWGERCVRVCSEETLPALVAALMELRRPTRIMLYTDSAQLIARAESLLLHAQEWCSVLPRPVLGGQDRGFVALSACHNDAMEQAHHGERVLLLTADMIVSREVLVTCEQQALRGMRAIACVAMRALEGRGAPIGASGAELLEWAWAHRHRMTRECTWPDGRSYDLWRMYFEKNGEVGARAFLPHPLVVVPAALSIVFGPTIDVNLLGCFSQAETYLITRPEEGAAVELSPPDKEFVETEPMHERFVTSEHSAPPFMTQTNARHRMFFGKRVVICGSGGDCGDAAVVERMLGA